MKILMVCLGNICRSPLAEGILKSKLPSGFTVDSAGTIDMHQGKQPDERSIAAAKRNGLDISSQTSRLFTAEDFAKYDRIYCMDRANLKDVLALAKTDKDRQKVSLILDDAEVPDPYWGVDQDFDDVYQTLDEVCDRIAAELQQEKAIK